MLTSLLSTPPPDFQTFLRPCISTLQCGLDSQKSRVYNVHGCGTFLKYFAKFIDFLIDGQILLLLSSFCLEHEGKLPNNATQTHSIFVKL